MNEVLVKDLISRHQGKIIKFIKTSN